MARRRHLDALERAAERLLVAKEQLEVFVAGELVAEELRLAQESLSRSPVSSARRSAGPHLLQLLHRQITPHGRQ